MTSRETAELIQELSNGKIKWHSVIEPTMDFDGLIQINEEISVQIGETYFLVVQNFKGDTFKGRETRWSGNVMPMTNDINVVVEQILQLKAGQPKW